MMKQTGVDIERKESPRLFEENGGLVFCIGDFI